MPSNIVINNVFIKTFLSWFLQIHFYSTINPHHFKRSEKMKKKRTALVTGASAGIGLEFSRLLASKGYHLVICARRKKRLETIAEKLRKKYLIDVLVMESDLSLRETPDEIFEILKKKNIQIDFLVNNAGYSLKKKFTRNSWDDVDKFLNLMLSSVTKMSHLFLPGMKERGFGRIINVSSVAAYVPEDKGSLYTAVKKYVLSFSKATAKEMKGTGVYVLGLCPGFTHTEFHDVLGNKKAVSKFPKAMWMNSDRVVKEGYEAVMKGKSVHINGYINKLICFLCTLLPESLINKMGSKKIEKSYKV